MLTANYTIALYVLGAVIVIALIEVWVNIRFAQTASDFAKQDGAQQKAWHWLILIAFAIVGLTALWGQLYLAALLMES